MTSTGRMGVSPRLALAAIVAAVAVAVPAILAAVGVRLWWLLGLGAVVAAAGGVFAPGFSDSYRRARERGEGSSLALSRDSVVRRVREITDPVVLGVHPARYGDSRDAESGPVDAAPGRSDRVPPYVPRDIHEQLVELLASGGFILLVGDSTAGKSRAAYEAMRAALPDHTVIAPRGKAVLPDAVERASVLSRSVLWLDNAERFLGADGLTRTSVARLTDGTAHHRVVLATLRSAEMARYADSGHPDTTDAAEVRQVLEQATPLRLRRALSAAERERARTRAWDQRIADALEHTGEYGLAEYLAAGPELLNDWENAWEAGHPRAAALIAAAVDCRRAGLTRPLPRTLLQELHDHYLTRFGGDRLGPEPLDEAWEWATRPRRATTALIRPGTDPATVEVFDYLVDASQRNTAPDNHIPDQTLAGALAESDATEAGEIGSLANGYGRYELAALAFEREHEMNSTSLGPEHPHTLISRSNRAVMLGRLGRFEEEETEARTVLNIRTRTLGREHPDTLASRTILAQALSNRGDYTQSEHEIRAALETFARILGAGHEHTLATRANLGTALLRQGRHEEAETEARAALEGRARTLGLDHPDTLTSRNNLGAVLERMGQYREAEAELRVALEGFVRILGPEHPSTTATRTLFADALVSLGRLTEAESEARHVLTVRTRTLGDEHPEIVERRSELGGLLRRMERYEQAEAELAAVLEIRTRLLGPEHPDTLTSRNNRAVVMSNMGRIEEAAAEHRHILQVRTRLQGPDDEETLRSHANLAITLGELGQFEEAERHAQIALEGRTRILGPDHPDTANSRNTLGSLLRDQGRDDDADGIS